MSKRCTSCSRAIAGMSYFSKARVQDKSELVNPPKKFRVELCINCCVDLMRGLIDSLPLTEYNNFVKKHGKEVI